MTSTPRLSTYLDKFETKKLSDAQLLALLFDPEETLTGPAVDTAQRMINQHHGQLSSLISGAETSAPEHRHPHEPEYIRIAVLRELVLRGIQDNLIVNCEMSSPEATRKFLKVRYLAEEREVFVVLFLSAQNHLIKAEDVFYGTLDGAAVYPREIVKRALQLNASAVILAHNHPSGVAEPSQADQRITERIQSSLGLLDIRVLDHIIIGKDQEFSFAERGLL